MFMHQHIKQTMVTARKDKIHMYKKTPTYGQVDYVILSLEDVWEVHNIKDDIVRFLTAMQQYM